MEYIEQLRSLIDGKTKTGNALDHGLHEIISEVNTKGYCTREYVFMNNAYFRFFEVLQPDWQKNLKEILSAFGVEFKISTNGQFLEFKKCSL